MKRRNIFITAALVLAAAVGDPISSVMADPTLPISVALQQATATYSQEADGGFTVAKAIDHIPGDDKGWSISPVLGPQTAVFETATDVGFPLGGKLTFFLNQSHSNPEHTLGRFRISVTTDDRTNFADGLVIGGDVTANWLVLVPESVLSANGTVLSVLPDGSILASGPSPATEIYALTVRTFMTGITGFRLEALTDPSLPNNGPGRRAENGNFCLSEFFVTIEPAGCTPVTNTVVIFNTTVVTNTVTNTVSLGTLQTNVASSGVSPRAMRALNREIQRSETRLQKLGEAVSRRIGPVNNELAEKIRADIQVLIGETDQ